MDHKKPEALRLEIEELERGRRPGGCQTSALLVAGYVSVPLAVLAGILR